MEARDLRSTGTERSADVSMVDVAPVPDVQDGQSAMWVVNFVDDPVIADSDSPAIPGGELSTVLDEGYRQEQRSQP